MTNNECGWIPNTTVQFIANLVGIIKIFVPLLLIIMGSIDFAKAIVSQKEDEIKKSQTSFIQKIIAGVAVFFVIVFVGWVLKIINNADPSTNANKALSCLNLMLNGGYNAEKIETLNPPTTSSTSATTVPSYSEITYTYNECKATCDTMLDEKVTDNIQTAPPAYAVGNPTFNLTLFWASIGINSAKISNYDELYPLCVNACGTYEYKNYYENSCVKAYYVDFDTYKNSNEAKECLKNNSNLFEKEWKEEAACYENIGKQINTCIDNSYGKTLEGENESKDACMASYNCDNLKNCWECATSIDKYNYCSAEQYKVWTSKTEGYYENVDEFVDACKKGNIPDNSCSFWHPFEPEKCCQEAYNDLIKIRNDFVIETCNNLLNDTVKYYCQLNPENCPYYFN